jgi:hypothetical protein
MQIPAKRRPLFKRDTTPDMLRDVGFNHVREQMDIESATRRLRSRDPEETTLQDILREVS